jgi:tetratricopeptide (TPR) repeat protein
MKRILLVGVWLLLEALHSSSRLNATPEDDPFEKGMAALRRRDLPEAIEWLKKVPDGHRNFTEAMTTLGLRIYGAALDRPEEGLPFVGRAYEKAPEDMEVVKAYIDINVMSGKAFEKAGPRRDHAKEVKPEFLFIVEEVRFKDTTPRRARADLEADLDYLEDRLAHCYSYADRLGVDYLGALDTLRLALKDETPIATFALKLTKLLCRGSRRRNCPSRSRKWRPTAARDSSTTEMASSRTCW